MPTTGTEKTADDVVNDILEVSVTDMSKILDVAPADNEARRRHLAQW